jgi:pimeloyl-ACP methyl ester carboxylesterase
MSAGEPHFLNVEGRRIAWLSEPAPDGGTGLFWLSGFKSDMSSTKAEALAEFARGTRAEPSTRKRVPLGITRFDYSGHGLSGGRFDEGTIGAWLTEAIAVFAKTSGPQIIVGSSMGGYIALLLLRRLLDRQSAEAARIKALVLIAPAWDMTEELMWKAFSPDQKAALMKEGSYSRPSDYGEPYRITRDLIEEGRAHLLAQRSFDPGRRVHILQGVLDDAVPISHVLKLKTLLIGNHITIDEIPDGDHRLSRPQDISHLLGVIAEMAA